MLVEVGSAWRPATGQSVCGDVHAAVLHAAGTLLCLADGLGHGAGAREAAEASCAYARGHAGEPLMTILHGMDAAISRTRGAAVSLVSLEPRAGRALFAGVGNVELRAAARAHIAPPTMPGVVGRRMRPTRVWEYPLAAGDLLVLVTDGISSRFELNALAHLAPQALAEQIVAAYHKDHDDACCVAARVAGPGHRPGRRADEPPSAPGLARSGAG